MSKNNISYKPDIKYNKKYDTIGKFSYDNTTETTNTTIEKNLYPSLPEIQEELKKIYDYVETIPTDVFKVIKPMIEIGRTILKEIDPIYYNPNTVIANKKISVTKNAEDRSSTNKSTPTTTNISTKINEKKKFPTSVFSNNVNKFSVDIYEIDNNTKLNIEYNKTLASILTDYINNLNKVFATYISNLTSILYKAGITNLNILLEEYKTKTTDIKDPNLYHISDNIIRSSIVRGQQLRLMSKLFSEEEANNQVEACRISKDLNKRYNNEKSISNNTYLNLIQNDLLKHSKVLYGQKTEDNLYNLYKYLNSSVKSIEETLTLLLKEAHSRAILKKEGAI